MLLGVPDQVNNNSSDNDYGPNSDNYTTAGYAAAAAHSPRARTDRAPRNYCTRYECLPSGPHARPAFHNIAVTDEPDYVDEDDPEFSLCYWHRARQTPRPQPPSKTCFPFLRLPAEIRNAIYRLVFVRPGTLQVLPAALRWGPRLWLRHVRPGEPCSNLPVDIYPAMLLVNRQVHGEAASIFYGENRFSFYLGPRITDGRVSLRALNDRCPSSPFSMLSSANAKHLRRCEILIWLNSSRGSEMRARYNTYQSWLAELASKMVEPGVDRSHALRDVDIVFQDGCYSRVRGRRVLPRPLDRCHQFLLEPLATIYGIVRVNIKAKLLGGFDAELVCAMTAKRRMVEPPEEDQSLVKYRRNRKVHWRRKKRFGRYDERRWNWLPQTKAVEEGST